LSVFSDEEQAERPSQTHQIRRHVAVVQVQSVSRVVEGWIHALLVSYFVVLEMFFLFKNNVIFEKKKENDRKEQTA
jgi:hypothetical protein